MLAGHCLIGLASLTLAVSVALGFDRFRPGGAE